MYFVFEGLNWVPMTAYSAVPMDAVVAGHDLDGSAIYVGRAYHEGDLIPAKVIPSKQVAYVPHGGQEVPKNEYQVRIRISFFFSEIQMRLD